MRKPTKLAIAILLASATPAFSQAAAESVMIHSMSAGATAKAGTSLGRSTSNAAGRLAGRLPGATPTASSHSAGAFSSRGRGTALPPKNAGTNTPGACPTTDQSSAGKTEAAKTEVQAGCQAAAPAQAPQDTNKYKKFVTLTFPK